MRLCQGNRTKLRMDRITDRLVRWPTSFLGAVAEKDCFHVYNKTVRRRGNQHVYKPLKASFILVPIPIPLSFFPKRAFWRSH